MIHSTPPPLTPEWTRACLASVTANAAVFRQVIDRWIAEPELIIPPVRGCEILSDNNNNENDACQITDEMDATLRKRVRRRLLPKRLDKDAPLIECIEIRVIGPEYTGGPVQTRAEFRPEFESIVSATMLPFYYPKVRAFAFVLEQPQHEPPDRGVTSGNSNDNTYKLDENDNAPAEFNCSQLEITQPSSEMDDQPVNLWIEYLPLPDANSVIDKSASVWPQLLTRLRKWCHNTMIGYQKRSCHDQLVSKEVYLAMYAQLKAKYAKYWVQHWPEKTDPRKFVFEDIAIAAWLLCLWQEEEKSSLENRRPTFIDLGCGNGLLTHLLTSEGYSGIGIDLADRGVWQQYGSATQLATCALLPNEVRFNTAAKDGQRMDQQDPWSMLDRVDWIIGNHADELVPWIPIIAARSGYSPKFAIIPCCFYTLDGQRRLPKLPGLSRYLSYQRYLEDIITTCGYVIERDQLRIPSTKNIAYVGRRRTFTPGDPLATTIQDNIDRLAHQGDTFKVRATDRAKEAMRREKQEERRYHKE